MNKDVVKVLGFSSNESKFMIKSRDFSFTVNNELDFVEQVEDSSVEILLASLAGSINSIGKRIAKELEVNLKYIQIEISGELDNIKLISSSTYSDKVPFKKINVVIKPSSNSSIILLKQWMDLVKNDCPIYNRLRESTSVILTLVKEYKEIKFD